VKLKKYTIVLEIYLKGELEEDEDIYEILDKAIDYNWYIDSEEEVEK